MNCLNNYIAIVDEERRRYKYVLKVFQLKSPSI